MKNFLLISLSLVLSFSSCINKNEDSETISQTENNDTIKIKVKPDSAITIDSKSAIYFNLSNSNSQTENFNSAIDFLKEKDIKVIEYQKNHKHILFKGNKITAALYIDSIISEGKSSIMLFNPENDKFDSFNDSDITDEYTEIFDTVY